MTLPLYNPINSGFFAGFGNHVQAVRLTYTVPAGKIAILTADLGLWEGVVVAAFFLQVLLIVNGVTKFGIANVGALSGQSISIPDIVLTTGDVIRIDTINAAAVVELYSGAFHIREYQ